MSAPCEGTASGAGSHLLAYHSFCHGNRYSRVGEVGMKPNGPGESGEVRASAVRSALPSVVNVGVPVLGTVSHGPRAAWLLRPMSQPSAIRKQPVMRLSAVR